VFLLSAKKLNNFYKVLHISLDLEDQEIIEYVTLFYVRIENALHKFDVFTVEHKPEAEPCALAFSLRHTRLVDVIIVRVCYHDEHRMLLTGPDITEFFAVRLCPDRAKLESYKAKPGRRHLQRGAPNSPLTAPRAATTAVARARAMRA
jgi:hypothetical protein